MIGDIVENIHVDVGGMDGNLSNDVAVIADDHAGNNRLGRR